MESVTGKLKPYDLVALLVDVPEHDLLRGDVGTVIEVFEANEHQPDGYLVEFVNEGGETRIELDVTDPKQVMQIHFKLRAA